MITCQKCGAIFRDNTTLYTYPAHHFSSASYPKDSYTTPAQIEAAGETMLSCPFDEGEAPPEYQTGSTPAGGSMYDGDDRYTAGDEENPEDPDTPADVTFKPGA